MKEGKEWEVKGLTSEARGLYNVEEVEIFVSLKRGIIERAKGMGD